MPINRILFPVQLHDGVLAHAAARRLDQSNYRYEHNLGAVETVDVATMLPERSSRDESICQMVEKFCGAGKGNIRCSEDKGSASKHPVTFGNSQELQKWLRHGVVDFAEIFKGCGELTIRVCEAGCTASEGFDVKSVTYERCWFLDRDEDQQDCAWLVVYGLRPKVIHCERPAQKCVCWVPGNWTK